MNGINHDTSENAYSSKLIAFNSKMYSMWRESYGTTSQIRMTVYNGNDSSPEWTFLDGDTSTGINKNTAVYAYGGNLTIFNSKLYASWYENPDPRQIRVVVGQ